jgi:hypothetical protein
MTNWNKRYASEKSAINLNIVHDVASMAPHALNALKDVGHGVANAFDHVRHFVSEIGHADKFLNPASGPHDSGNYNYQFHNYLKNQLPDITKHMSDRQIYNIADQWRVHGPDALKHIPGLDSSSIDSINSGLSATKYNMDSNADGPFIEGLGSMGLTVGVPIATGFGIKKLKETLNDRKDQRRQNSSGSAYNYFADSRGRRSNVNFQERYNNEKIAHDPSLIAPMLHGLSQVGHEVGNVWNQMIHPWTEHSTIDPGIQHLMEQNINHQAILHNGPGVERTQQILNDYQNDNTQINYHPLGIGSDLVGGSAAAFGIKKLKDKMFNRNVDPVLKKRQQHLIHDHGFNNLQEALADYNFIDGRADNKYHLSELHGLDHTFGDMGDFHHEHPEARFS